jgi:hypothetical protein
MKIAMRANDTLLFTTLTRTAVTAIGALWLCLIPTGSFAALENTELLEKQPVLEASVQFPLPATSEPHEQAVTDADSHDATYTTLAVDNARLSPLAAELSLGAFQRYQNAQPQADSGTPDPLSGAQEQPLTGDNDQLATIPNVVLLCISVVIGLVAVARRNSV